MQSLQFINDNIFLFFYYINKMYPAIQNNTAENL